VEVEVCEHVALGLRVLGLGLLGRQRPFLLHVTDTTYHERKDGDKESSG
jgi:hypothetical protein